VLWLTKPYKIGTTLADNALEHGVGPYNETAFLKYVDHPDNILSLGFAPGEGGLHPTQKPLSLMKALIELTTRPGQIVLDPITGSGTTLLAARDLGRRYVGFEMNEDYIEVFNTRASEITN